MPRHTSILNAYINSYLAVLKKEGRSVGTYDGEYRRLITQAVYAWDELGLRTNPKRVGEEEIDFLRFELYAGLSPHVNRWQLSIIGTWLEWHGNVVVKKMKIGWPQDTRVNVDWLTTQQAIALMEHASEMERILVHLELGLGLRRCEVLRLRVQDLKCGHVSVLGKGTQGGKWRTVSFHPDTNAELSYYFKLRGLWEEQHRARWPDVPIPESVAIWKHKTKIRALSESGVDNHIKRACARIGCPDASNHTLRRTCCRLMYHAGVKLAVIASIMGHKDEATTIRYAGLNLDDQDEAMLSYGRYLRSQKTGTQAPGQESEWAQRDLDLGQPSGQLYIVPKTRNRKP